MATATPCQTPGAQLHTTVTARRLSVAVDLPGRLDLAAAEAEQVEADLHNAVELVLARWWPRIGPPEPNEGDGDTGCKAEVWSWDHFRGSQVDAYWIRCSLAGPHDEHEDSHTGLTWKAA